MSTDAELLGKWRKGDLGAGDTLFCRHFSCVHRFFRNKVGVGLEDLVQQTFMRCVEMQDRFREDSTFRTFLLGIANNMLREHYRKIRRDETRLDFTTCTVADSGAGPSTLLGKRREQKLLLEALQHIPLDNQIALELFYWEGLTAAEIGAVLDLPEGTVRGRLRRAKELLRRQLKRLSRSSVELESTLGNLDGWARQLREMLSPPAQEQV